MNLIDVVAFGVGGILIYSAVKDKNPASVIKDALGGKVSASVQKDGTSSNSSGGDVPPGKQFVDGTGDVPTVPGGSAHMGTPAVYETPYPQFVSV